MLNNIIEFKEFLDYYQTILKACVKANEKIKITCSHKDNEMNIKVISDSGVSIDTFKCSNELYHQIMDLLLSSFVSTNKIILASRKDKKYSVRSEKIEINCEINNDLSQKISDQVFNKTNNSDNEKNHNLSEFEKVSNFFRCYSSFLKRCVKKEKASFITITYNNGIYSIDITNDGKVVFSRKITCSAIKAKYLNKIICENIIDENSIKLSSITRNNKLQVQTPKICLSIPYDNSLEKFHEEALAKMNEYNVSISMQKVKSSNR